MRTSFCLGLLAFLLFVFGLNLSVSGADDIALASRNKVKYLLPEQSAAVFFSGTTYPVWNNPDGLAFFRMTGINQPGLILILFPGEILWNGNRITELVLAPPAGEWPLYWSSNSLTTADIQKISGISTVSALSELSLLLEEVKRNGWVNKYLLTGFPAYAPPAPGLDSYEKALASFRNVLHIPFAYAAEMSALWKEVCLAPSQNFEIWSRKGKNYLAYYPEFRQDSLLNALASVHSATEFSKVKTMAMNLLADVHSLPSILNKVTDKKTPEEIIRFKSAASECARTLDEWLKIIEPEIPQHKLAAAWNLIACNTAGCSPTEIRLNSGSQILSPNSPVPFTRLRTGDLLRVDAGIRVQGYPVFITRTVPVSGKYSTEQRALLSLALKAQEAGIRKMKPGVRPSEIHEAMKNALWSACKELGILKNESDLNKILPESLVSHANLSLAESGSDEPLEPGAILYLRPVICINPQAPCPQAYWNMSISVADPVLLSSAGAEFLEITLPRTASELETRVSESSPLNQLVR